MISTRLFPKNVVVNAALNIVKYTALVVNFVEALVQNFISTYFRLFFLSSIDDTVKELGIGACFMWKHSSLDL